MPSSAELHVLTRFERFTFAVARFINESRLLKAVSHRVNLTAGRPWMTLVSSRRIKLVGIEKLAALRPERGVLLAANHRSFFDMYMVTTYLTRHVDYCRRLYFPVRSGFWYDHPLGMVVNGLASGMSMYPPVFRAPEKKGVTRAGLDYLADELQKRGTVVGIHPEGTRSTGDDPYELLPPEPGFGRLVLKARPIVVPVFVNGMGNNLAREIVGTMTKKGPPIGIVFGDPMDLSRWDGSDPTRLRDQQAVGRAVLDEIRRLGELDRELRAAPAAG